MSSHGNGERAQAALGQAIEDDDRLLLVYQPIHDMRTGAIVAAEALLRQRRENGEIREASIITEAAEESSGPEIFLLDSMVMRRAFSDATLWSDVRLHLNLSPREFEDGHIIDRVDSLIASSGIDARRVSLEITETSQIEQPEATMEVLRALKELGVQLWLDDFGTRHSSIEHLQHFPVDGLKLPGAFVRPLPDDERCVAITRALIDLAHDLDMHVIAEEVENRAQLDFLLEQRCELVQGFLFSKPVTAERLQATLAAARFSSDGA